MKYDEKTVASFCDHTLLKPTANANDVIQICNEALQYGAASVCVNSCFVELVSEQLKGSNVKTCSVIGFPLGSMSTRAKVEETRIAVEDGAEEIDMVINVGMLQSSNYDYIQKDIKAVVDAAMGKCVKVIIETCFLNDEQKVKACEISMNAGAAFVKTSTGMATGGATASDVSLMRSIVKDKMGVKASGGIRTLDDFVAMVESGANRIGTGSMIAIIKEVEGK